jgi:HSP20 family protein
VATPCAWVSTALETGPSARIQIRVESYRRKTWMWAEACALLEQAERKQRHFFELVSLPAALPAWEPPADIFTDGTQFDVVVALPGARAEDIRVQITAGGLQIDTQVAPPAAANTLKVVRFEIPYGRMRRRIDLPPGRYILVERRLDRGYLHLRLTREAV